MNIKTFSIQTTCKLIQFPLGGERKFFKWLREKGYLLTNNEPAQKYLNLGLFILVKKTIKRGNQPITLLLPRVTLKGLNYLNESVKKDFPICKPCSDAN